jgi:WD40 repeat protein
MSDDIRLPASILLYHVAPFLEDRKTWNALVMVSKEVYSLSKDNECSSSSLGISAPWPHQVRLRITAGRAAWSIAFAVDFVACGTDERGQIQVWNKRDGRGRILFSDQPHHKRGRVHSIIVIHNLLITGSEDGAVVVWKDHDWSSAGNYFSVYKGGVTCMCAWFNNESGKVRIAAGCTDRKIRIFQLHEDIENRIEFQEDLAFPIIETTHRGPIHAICKLNQFLVSGGSDERLLVWDINPDHNNDIQLHKIPRQVHLPNLDPIRSFSVYNDCLLAAACGKTIILYDDSLTETKFLKGHHSNILSVSFSEDGDLIASACSDGTIRLWKASGEICLKEWEVHRSFLVCALAFQGRSLASVGTDGTIAFWSIPRL